MPKASKSKPIVPTREKPTQKRKADSAPAPTLHPVKKHKPSASTPHNASTKNPHYPSDGPKPHLCSSAVDRQAAFAVQKLLEADASKSHGATLKALTLAPHVVAKGATYAVTCQVLKYISVLQDLDDAVAFSAGNPRVSRYTAYVLIYELLIGEGLQRRGRAEKLVLAKQALLQQALKALLKRSNVKTVQELLPSGQAGPAVPHPRWARVNTLKRSMDEVLQLLREPPAEWKVKAGLGSSVEVDDLLPDLLRLPPGTDLHDHPLVKEGALVLQSKASCMPAHALAPRPEWVVMDCCAAPGNKTTHVAALMGGKGNVLAFDKDAKRLARLQANADKTGAHNITAQRADFLSIDPTAPEYSRVCGVILDPSCSGSGTTFTRMDHLMPSHRDPLHEEGQGGSPEEVARVAQLAKFQKLALSHALKLPALQRLVYSTCSVHVQENEEVVLAVLEEAHAAGLDLVDPFPAWHRRGLPLFPGCEMLVRTDANEDGTDGFFVAVFQRGPAAAAAAGTVGLELNGVGVSSSSGVKSSNGKVAELAEQGLRARHTDVSGVAKLKPSSGKTTKLGVQNSLSDGTVPAPRSSSRQDSGKPSNPGAGKMTVLEKLKRKGQAAEGFEPQVQGKAGKVRKGAALQK